MKKKKEKINNLPKISSSIVKNALHLGSILVKQSLYNNKNSAGCTLGDRLAIDMRKIFLKMKFVNRHWRLMVPVLFQSILYNSNKSWPKVEPKWTPSQTVKWRKFRGIFIIEVI